MLLLVIFYQAAESGKLLETQVSVVPPINRKPEVEYILIVLLLSLFVRQFRIYNLFE